jgi:death on curing protein
MHFLDLDEVLELHALAIEQTGGSFGVRDHGALDSALAQPRMSFGGADLYPTLVDKAGAMGFSLIANHPFVDGNKRTGYASMETLLVMNGHEIRATVDDAERITLAVAAGQASRQELIDWLNKHVVEMT